MAVTTNRAADAPFRVETYRLHRGPSFLTGFGRALYKNLPLQSGLFYQPDLGRPTVVTLQ